MKKNQETKQCEELNRLLSLLAGIKIKAEIATIKINSIGDVKANATSNYYLSSYIKRLHEDLVEAITVFEEITSSRLTERKVLEFLGDLILERADDLIALNLLFDLKTEKL